MHRARGSRWCPPGSEDGRVGEGGDVQVVGQIDGVLVISGEEHDNAVLGGAEVLEVDGLVGVDDEPCRCPG
jgi:hypothetical protein